MDGRISAAAPLALADQLPLPIIVNRGWSGFVPARRTIKESLTLALALTSFVTRHERINSYRHVVTSVVTSRGLHNTLIVGYQIYSKVN